MGSETKKIFDYLYNRFTKPGYGSDLPGIFKTFSECSKSDTGKQLVGNHIVKAIRFDLLTKWLYKFQSNIPKSADALSFVGNDIYLVEFKSEDQIEKSQKKKKLITGVIGKINDSEKSIYREIFTHVDELQEDKVKLRFYLVVDAEAMGVDVLLQELVFRSKGSLPTGNAKINALIGEVLPNLKDGVDNPDHYKDIDIWFSELFDTYLSSYGIRDVEAMLTVNVNIKDSEEKLQEEL